MYHRNYTTYLQKELDFLKLLVTRFHEQEKVTGLELDVALLKTQEVYEQLLRIKMIPEAEASVDAIVEKTIPKPVQRFESPKKEPHTEEIVASEKVVFEQEKKIPKKEPAPVREEKKPPSDPAKTAILAEKISPSDFHPINETLAQKKQGNNLSNKLQTAPLSSIMYGIGLNDRFLYIRELFKGDNVMFSDAIRHLDAAESLDAALDLIHRNFDWDEKNETVQKFIHLVYRRHGERP